MTISTLICGYNQGRYAAAAIESVLRQTAHPLEIIFVDNGSTDETAEVVNAFVPVVRYVRQNNQGPSGARNRGMNEAVGDFVHFLDADDWIEEDMYAAVRDAFAQSPGADVLVGGEIDVLPDGTISRREDAPKHLDDATAFLFGRHPWCVHAALVRRKTALAIGGFSPALWRCEDWDFWLRLAQAKAVFVPFPGRHAIYRRVPASNSSSYAHSYRAARSVLRDNARRSRSKTHRELAARCLVNVGESMWISHVRPELDQAIHHSRWLHLAAVITRALATDPRNLARILGHVRHVLGRCFRKACW